MTKADLQARAADESYAVEFELADGSRLVLDEVAAVARCQARGEQPITLADAMSQAPGPFAGYRLLSGRTAG